MTDELDKYIEAHIDEEPEHLRNLFRESNLRMVHGRMCSGHLQGRLLKMLMHMINPRRVLELGTYTGYSSMCMAEGIADDATIDTIEIDDELEDFIRDQYSRSPHAGKIRLHIGDAMDVLPTLPDDYDVAFIDANKRLYCDYYRLVLPKLRPGGFMLVDNTLWDGHVVDPHHSDPQTRGVMEFNDMVAADPRVEKVILPLRDGLTLIRKKLF